MFMSKSPRPSREFTNSESADSQLTETGANNKKRGNEVAALFVYLHPLSIVPFVQMVKCPRETYPQSPIVDIIIILYTNRRKRDC